MKIGVIIYCTGYVILAFCTGYFILDDHRVLVGFCVDGGKITSFSFRLRTLFLLSLYVWAFGYLVYAIYNSYHETKREKLLKSFDDTDQ